MIKYYPGKLNIEDVFKVNLSNGLKNISDIKWYILSLIIGVDSRARDEALAKALRSLESGDIVTGRSMFRRGKAASVGGVKVCVHPQDVLCALFLCSSHLLQKILVSKLFMCKIAIPFVFKLESRLIFSFWPLHFIRVEGKYKNNRGIDGYLSDKELKSISFLKIGETEVSKSELINKVIKSRVLMESFYHRNCILGNNSRFISNGSIEFSLFLPSGKDSDAFDDIILFQNLRGNAIDQTKQVFLMNEISSFTVIFMNIQQLRNETNVRFLKEMHQTLGSSISEIVYIIESNDSTEEEFDTLTEVLDDIKTVSKKHIEIVDITDESRKTKNLSNVTEYIQNYLSVGLSKSKSTTLAEIERIFVKHDIETQQEDDVFKNAKTKAQDIFHYLKSQKAPLTTLWKQYSIFLKELNKERNASRKMEIINQMRHIRQQQYDVCSRFSTEQKLFINFLVGTDTKPNMLALCITHLKMLLEIESFRNVGIHQSKSEPVVFGIEHVIREISQIYECLQEIRPPLADTKFMHAVKFSQTAVAKMLVTGHPLEIMDGDACNIPMAWIENMFLGLKTEIGENTKILSLSLLGLQSSGKSTLLNAMFGLQLAVDAGQCTKGVFLQLVPLPVGQYPFDYILVIDTEGLRAPERKSISHEHDNKLATFVTGIGDVTVINIKGENTSEIGDILEIVVHAFLRLKQVSKNFQLQQSCIFVHQNVPNSLAKEKMLPGTLRLVKCLDDMTKDAANYEGIQNCDTFSDVIHFDSDKHVFHFPDLWCGTPPMCAVNSGYSENVESLKRNILLDISSRRSTYFTTQDIFERIKNLWSGILSEDFVYCYRNGIELKTVRKVEGKIFELKRKIESVSSRFLKIKVDLFLKKCKSEKDLERIKDKLKELLTQELEDHLKMIVNEWKTFVEKDDLKDIIMQWNEPNISKLTRAFKEVLNAGIENIEKKINKYRLEIRQKIILSTADRKHWEQYAASFVEPYTSFPMDVDITSCFEHIWRQSIEHYGLRQNIPKIEIERETKKVLWDYFETEATYLKKEFKAIEASPCRDQTKMISLDQIKENHITSKKTSSHTKEWAYQLTCNLCHAMEIVLDSRPVEKFDIDNVRTLFDTFELEFNNVNKRAHDHYSFNFTISFKAMLAVRVCNMAVRFYKNDEYEYEQKYGVKKKESELRKELLNHFRKLVTENMLQKLQSVPTMIQEMSPEQTMTDVDEGQQTPNVQKQHVVNTKDGNIKPCAEIKTSQEVGSHDERCAANMPIETEEAKMLYSRRTRLNTQHEGEQHAQAHLRHQSKIPTQVLQENWKQQDIDTAKQVARIIAECVTSNVKIWLPDKIVNIMLKKFMFVKHELIKCIMTHLAEQEDFNQYYSYIENTSAYVQEYIKTSTESIISSETLFFKELVAHRVSSTYDHILKVIKSTKSSPNNMHEFLKNLIDRTATESLRTTVDAFSMSCEDFTVVESIHVNDFLTLVEYLQIILKENKESCLQEIKNLQRGSSWNVINPYKVIFKQLWGCEEQCPFCNEPCQYTDRKHDERHSCLLHRPEGVQGWRFIDTCRLSIDICNVNMQSEDAFDCNLRSRRYKCHEHKQTEEQTWHPYREFRTYAPDWDIAPDPSLKNTEYWAWYLFTFRKKIEENYNVRFPILPTHWAHKSKCTKITAKFVRII